MLRILQAAGSFPERVYASSLADPALLRSLHRIANNAYPGFRPSTAGRETPLSPAFPRKNVQALARKQAAAAAGGGDLASVRMEVPPPSDFGLLKPRSAEAQLISDLAREVAYLIGVTRRPLTTVAGPLSPPRQEEKVRPEKVAAERKKVKKLLDSVSKHACEDRKQKITPSEGAESSKKSIDATESANKQVDVGDKKDIDAAAVVKLAVPNSLSSREGIGDGAILGRPGTYLGCGVTTCSGLGATGEHGDTTITGNVPHPAFVLRKTDNQKDIRGDSNKCAGDKDEHGETTTITESLGSISTGSTTNRCARATTARGDASMSAGCDAEDDICGAGSATNRGGSMSVGHDANGGRYDAESATNRSAASMSAGGDADDGRCDAGAAILSSPGDIIVATPLALLSAREANFRAELIRRKEHYKLGGGGKESNLNPEKNERHKLEGTAKKENFNLEANEQKPKPPTKPLGRSEHFKAFAPLAQSGRKKCPLRVVERKKCTTPPRRGLGEKAKVSPDHVDVARSPLLASTRPIGVQPQAQLLAPPRKVLDEGNGYCVGLCTAAVVRPTYPIGVDERDCRKTDAAFEGNGKSLSPPPAVKQGKEFVSFARPAAHWSVTVGLSARGRGGASPTRVRGKGLRFANANATGGSGSGDGVGGGVGDGGGGGGRGGGGGSSGGGGGVGVAGGGGSGDVVGRFACRGYLLDPTFADSNPIILHPRLPRIVGGVGFTQVPETSTLPDHIASQVAKCVTTEGKNKGVEPYRNVVDVLRHHVDVSGGRPAGAQRYFSEQGRPLSPVNFEHVYDSVEKRKRGHAEPHLVVFP